jgi:hypothetical protein
VGFKLKFIKEISGLKILVSRQGCAKTQVHLNHFLKPSAHIQKPKLLKKKKKTDLIRLLKKQTGAPSQIFKT